MFKTLIKKDNSNIIYMRKNIDIIQFDNFMDELIKKINVDAIIKYNYESNNIDEISIIKKNITLKISKLLYNIRITKRKYCFQKFNYKIKPKKIKIMMHDTVYNLKTYIKYEIII